MKTKQQRVKAVYIKPLINVFKLFEEDHLMAASPGAGGSGVNVVPATEDNTDDELFG